MTEILQLSHLQQTVYFAAVRQGLHLLDADDMSRLVGVSRPHASKLLSEMAHKGALQRVGRGRYAVIPADVLYGRQAYVADPYQIIDALLRENGEPGYYVAYQSAALVCGAAQEVRLRAEIAETIVISCPFRRPCGRRAVALPRRLSPCLCRRMIALCGALVWEELGVIRNDLSTVVTSNWTEREFSLYHSRIASRLKAAVHVHISAPDARGKIKTGR